MEKDASQKNKGKKILVFRLQNTELALDIACVREVLRPQEIHPLPQAPDFVEGVINLRKHIITVIDLRKKFHIPPVEDKAAMRVILCKVKTFIVGVIVDSASEVLSLAPQEVQPPPAIVVLQMPGVQLSGIARVGERVISILDLDKILTEEEITRLSGVKK